MRREFNRHLLISACVLCSYGLAAGAVASPWNKSPGDILLISTTEQFNGDTDMGDLSQTNAQAYLEAGLGDRLMLGGKVIYSVQSQDGPDSDTRYGFSTAEIFAQQQIYRGERTVAAAKLLYAAETALTVNRLDGTTGESGQDAALEPAFLIGRALNEDGTQFASASIGYRYSLGGDADQLNTQFTLGVKPTPHWLITLKSLNTTSLGSAKPTGSDYDAYRLQPAIAYVTDRGHAYEVGLRGDVAGRNIAKGITAFFSIWSDF